MSWRSCYKSIVYKDETLCKCLVEVILSYRRPIVGSRKVDSRSVLVGHLAMSLIV